MKLLFYIDPHYSSVKPSTRIDDYCQASLDKTKQVVAICKEEKIDLVICGGDFFHVKNISFPFINQLIKEYNKFPCPVYGIGGNHDFYFGRIDSVERTPLGIFWESGVLKPLSFLEFPDFEIYGCHFGQSISEPSGKKFSILVAHGFLDETFAEKGVDLGAIQKYNLVLLGHDHMPREITAVGNTVVVRPGALMRGTQHQSNAREVFVAIIDMDTKKIVLRPLVVLPFEEIFLMQAIDRKEVNKDVKDFVATLESVDVGVVSVMDTLDSICKEPEVKNRVKYFLNRQAII